MSMTGLIISEMTAYQASPVHVVPEVVIAGEHGNGTESNRQTEERLGHSLIPNLLIINTD